ncbi:hypothetical protein [Deinococcus arenicola]|uniref:Uncharacterized protein n=1 Tax=Deinococcus arenicola TaxID=2994950 RepID=A0ABU4DMD7_9DEIO|nr:hypothetical protein [Deinococcus sp. ZS9-10]MDV6373055.1 hypothetical protein [Deinococcus sp. ZS9-10]
MPRRTRTIPPELLALLQGGLLPVHDPLPGLLKKARKLPLDRSGVWLLLTPRLSLPGVSGEMPTLVMLLDMTHKTLLYQDMLEDATTADLTRLVLETMLEPMPATRDEGGRTLTLSPVAARQPARLLAPDAYAAQSLATELALLKMEVTHDDSPETAQMLAALVEPFQTALSAQADAMRPMPVLTGQTDEAVRAFHTALSAYCHAKTWEVFDPLKLVRAGWTDGQGQAVQCCASVMGEAGSEFGLALYARAAEWALMSQSDHPAEALNALDGMERVSLGEASQLAPEDLEAFMRLDLEPIRWGDESGWPILQRLTRNDLPGAEIAVRTAPPVTPLHAVTALLQVLADRAGAKPRRPVTSLIAEVGGVQVRYPSPPADDFSVSERRGTVRLTFDMPPEIASNTPEHLTLTAPASMTLHDVWSSARKQHRRERTVLPSYLEIPLDMDEDNENWFDAEAATLWNSNPGSPLLIMRHLPDAGTLEGGGMVVRAEWLPALEVSGVDLEIRGEGTAVRPKAGQFRADQSKAGKTKASQSKAAPVNIPLYPEPIQSEVAGKKAIETAKPQKRAQHEGMCRLCGFVGNKASMTRHLAKCEKRPAAGKGEHEVYRLRVSDSRSPAYWLDVEMPVTANLDDLDGFLRGIWLECCGHMSAFTIGPQDDYDNFNPFAGPNKKIKQPTLDGLKLNKGDKFGYTYDFGSSTELGVQVQAHETVAGKTKEKVRLLARNLPPALSCSECGKPAVWVNSWEYDETTGQPLLSCAEHGEEQDEAALMPVVNSPRMGVCGYDGGNLEDWPPVATT